MLTNFEQFNDLHNQAQPLMIGNVWDVKSAKVFANAGYQAIATSSAAVAATLGYEDNQNMPFSEYYALVKRIKSATAIPFSVDIESGYGNSPLKIADNIIALANAGVSGVNMEDSVVLHEERKMTDAKLFAKKLQDIVGLLSRANVKIFLNLRSDGFLLNLPNALDDARERINIYQQTGVNGLFFPGLVDATSIKELVSHTKLPINLMCMPGLPDFGTLTNLGVRRISQGPFVYSKSFAMLEGILKRITTEQTFESLFG